MKKVHSSIVWKPFALLLALFLTTLTYAEEIFQPSPNDIFITSTNGSKITCARASAADAWVPGYWKSASNVFTTAKEMARKKKAQVKSATDPAIKLKLQKAFQKIRSYLKNGIEICAAGPGESPPSGNPPTPNTPTPTPRAATPVPTRTPTPTSSTCNDSGGDSTRGRNFFILNCQGCHPVPTSLKGTSCSKLSSAYQRSDMKNINHTAQNDSDIVAYLKNP